MTIPAKPKLGLSSLTQLSPELEAALRANPRRRDKKINDAAFGVGIMLAGLLVLAATMWFAYVTRTQPPLVLLGGGVGIAGALFAVGGLIADKEAFGPALLGLARLVAFWRHK